MNLLEQVVLGLHGFGHALRLALRPAFWAPWIPVLTLELGVIGALWWFAHPALSWIMAPVLERAAGEGALRYPNVFRLMPGLYGWADVVIVVLLGSLAMGASTLLFAARFEGRTLAAGEGWRRAFARVGALVLANLPLNLLVLGVSLGVNSWMAERGGEGALARVSPALPFAAAILLQAFFLYLNPLLMLGGRSLAASFLALPDAVARGGWAALTLALAATLPLAPLQLLARTSSRIVDRGTPELVGWLVAAQALIALLAAFVLTGGATLVYQTLIAPRPEEER